jgi:hypothetical protein
MTPQSEEVSNERRLIIILLELTVYAGSRTNVKAARAEPSCLAASDTQDSEIEPSDDPMRRTPAHQTESSPDEQEDAIMAELVAMVQQWPMEEVEVAANQLWEEDWLRWQDDDEMCPADDEITHEPVSAEVRERSRRVYAQDEPAVLYPTPSNASAQPAPASPAPPNSARRKGTTVPPSSDEVNLVLDRITLIIRPHRGTSQRGHKNVKVTDHVLHARLRLLQAFLFLYWRSGYTRWIESSELAVAMENKGPWMARRLREWAREMVEDKEKLPVHRYGQFKSSVLDDEDIEQEIFSHLADLGDFFSAADIVKFLSKPEMMERLGLKKPIHEVTAERWLKRHEYRWQKTPTGQYVDGHKRDDVVAYRTHKFLPELLKLDTRLRKWDKDGKALGLALSGRVVVIWCHDESIFYAHDRRKLRWVRKSETAKPYAKGEGKSLMVADFVSADYGFLRSHDGYVSCLHSLTLNSIITT